MTIKRTPLITALVLALTVGVATATAARVTTTSPKMGEKNVVETAIAAGQFKTLASLLQKAAYIRLKGLGGSMMWSIDQDDSKASLTSALYSVLR